MAKLWQLKSEIPSNIAEKLSAYPKFLQQLLYNRELTEVELIEKFLNPKYEDLHSPYLFKDMQKAVGRIWRAIENSEKICIYSDYDADAVTANAVLQQTFRFLGVEVGSYIPDRFTEGYGINTDALQKIKDTGCSLIVTVDCGTNSTDAAEFCQANNIDLIITDHHEIIGPTPQAYALINPKNPGDSYPDSNITGVGVAFKLASAILKDQRAKAKDASRKDGWEKWLLDLVAIGTVADCHSLLGENRILVKYGLKVLAKTRWPGLRALIKSSGLDFSQKPPDSYTLGFILAPRLNAAGRLEHADSALQLLLASDGELARAQAESLEGLNRRRQDLTARILSDAREQALILGDRKILVMANKDWHKGVVGLVAGRLAEEFYRPVIVLEKTDELYTGSARTAGSFNIIEALKFSSEHLLRYGGHRQAAGLTLKTESFEIFYQKILSFAETHITEESSKKVLELETELDENDLSISSCELLQLLEPFGVGNPRPKFLLAGVKLLSSRTVGSASQHTQFNFQKGAVRLGGIAFNSSTWANKFEPGSDLDVAAELIEDGYNGRREVKLKIADIRPAIS